MKNLLILDVDGTLVSPIEGDFINSWNNQKLIPGVKTAIEKYKETHFMVLASNQGGISEGFKTVEDTVKQLDWVCSELGIRHALFAPDYEEITPVSRSYYVAFIPEPVLHIAESPYIKFRKPEPGMILAAKQLAMGLIELEDTLFVGDMESDRLAAKNAGVKFMWAKDWRKEYE